MGLQRARHDLATKQQQDSKYETTIGVTVHKGHQTSHNKSKQGSVQFSHLVVSDSLQPHESQHARPPCPSPSPGVHSNLGPSSL